MSMDERRSLVHEQLLMKHASNLTIPTNDNVVRSGLELLSEPITLFAERQLERRDRLTRLDDCNKVQDVEESASMVEHEEHSDKYYPFKPEGSHALLESREEIAKYSDTKSFLRRERLTRLDCNGVQDVEEPVSMVEHEEHIDQYYPFKPECSHAPLDSHRDIAKFSDTKSFSHRELLKRVDCNKVQDVEEPASMVEHEEHIDPYYPFKPEGSHALLEFHRAKHSDTKSFLGRERLTTLDCNKVQDVEEPASMVEHEEHIDQCYPFKTEGSHALLESRRDIAKYSHTKWFLRLKRLRRKRDHDLDHEDLDLSLKHAASLELISSEIGDDRPLSGCSVSHDGKMLATCSLSGVAKIWSMPNVKKVSTLVKYGHTQRATDVVFSPITSHQLATASADRTAKLWNMEGSILRTFKGHSDRLARIAYHPSGKYLGTASFDKTWRLWDIETGEELLLEEGHSRGVYGVSFHPDGSLAASFGLNSLARVWDLRSGKSILSLQGHVKPVLGLGFSPNGYNLATGGQDNNCMIWDLRKRQSIYTIHAHSNLISQVKYEPREGNYLVTASYDMSVKVWSSRDFKLIKTLAGHESKVTSFDIMEGGQSIVMVSHDGSIKLWSGKDEADDHEEVEY